MKKGKSPRRVFGYVRWSCFLFWNTKSHRMWMKWPFLWTPQSERRHAVEMKAGPLRATDVFISVHVWAVAMLICALWRLVGIILTYLLVLRLFFNAAHRTETYYQDLWPLNLSKTQLKWTSGYSYKACGGDCVALLSLWYPDPLARAPFICSWRTWGRECSGMLPIELCRQLLPSRPPLCRN